MWVSSSKAVVANRMPWMNARGDKDKLSSNIDSHQLLKGSKPLESSKDSEEDGPRQNGSSAETYILEMDKL
ncbi:hypothetical protein Bca4012_078420 [Brassica carinata]